MKTAVAYYRISDREQSNYSITGQRQSVGEYVKRLGIKLLGEYEDDGFSASSMDRPAWKRMMKDLRRKKPDYVLSTRYNRMARMAAEGLTAVENAERKHGCLFIAIEEVSYVDTLSPQFYKMRGEMFVNSEFERRVIGDQTMFGRFNGLRLGKFLNRPPYGYLKSDNPDLKSIPQKDPAHRHVVEAIGRMYFIEGMRSFGAIQEQAKKIGLSLIGRSAVKNLLMNPLYYGLVKFPSYKRQPGGMAEGQHEAYFPREWYYRIQASNEKIETVTYNTFDPDLPLRGLAIGPCCGNKLTGGKSRGGMGVYYANYKCNTCKGSNVSAKRADKMLHSLLDCITLNSDEVAFVQDATIAELERIDDSRIAQRQRLEKLIADTQKRIEVMDYRMLTVGVIKETTYLQHRGKAERDLNGYTIDLEEIQSQRENMDLSVLEYFAKIKSVVPVYEGMKVPEKQRFLSLLFGEIQLTKREYRTSKAPFVFKDRMLATNYLSLLSEEKPAINPAPVLLVPQTAQISNYCQELIYIANFLATAA